MQKLISYHSAQNIDSISQEKYAIPDIVLMEQAGNILVRLLEKELDNKKRKICVLCGSGNNGGDAQVLARTLFNKGYDISVSFVSKPKSRLACIQHDMLVSLNCPILSLELMLQQIASLDAHDWIVDGIAGVGINRPLQYQDVVSCVNESNAKKLAVDIPSGILEQWEGKQQSLVSSSVIQADVTVSFGLAKMAMYYPHNRTRCGTIIVENPGFPQQVLDASKASAYIVEESDISLLMPAMSCDTYKRSRGVVLLAAGSKEMPGAAYLAARSASQSFAGMVYAVVDEHIAQGLSVYCPSVITGLSIQNIPSPHVALIGPGWGTTRDISFIDDIVHKHALTVIDADGLSYLERLTLYVHGHAVKEQQIPKLVLTPHIGEMRMLDADFVQHANLWHSAHTVSMRHNAVVIAKQSVTAIVYKDAVPLIVDGRHAALAKAGSGDVLAGIVASYLAYCMSNTDIHGPGLDAESIQKQVAIATLLHAKLACTISPYLSSAEELVANISSISQYIERKE